MFILPSQYDVSNVKDHCSILHDIHMVQIYSNYIMIETGRVNTSVKLQVCIFDHLL